MANQTTNTLSGTITAVDVNGTQFVTKPFGSPNFTGTAGLFISGQKISNGGGTNIALPVSPVKQLYVHNLSGTATMQLTWTPNGGASNIIITLSPNSVIALWDVGAGQGITALNIVSSVLNEEIEYFLGG